MAKTKKRFRGTTQLSTQIVMRAKCRKIHCDFERVFSAKSALRLVCVMAAYSSKGRSESQWVTFGFVLG